MENEKNPRFPRQSEPEKLHGTAGESAQKEKFLRDGGKIEDYPESERDNVAKMTPDPKSERNKDRNESSHLTDISGEEKKEDYINTDERMNDLKKRGLGNAD